jgi:hypothetical protein
MFLSEDTFLQEIGAYKHNFPIRNSKTDFSKILLDFTKKVHIQYRDPISIYDFINNISSADKRVQNMREWVQFFYDVLVVQRVDVLKRFYNSYLYTPEINTLFSDKLFDESIEELENSLIDEKEKTIFIQRKDKTKRILRNLYAKEILNDTTITNSLKGKPNFWKSLYDFFQGNIDDRLFAPSSIALYLRDGTPQTPIYLLQQYQSKASILNPAVLYVLLNTRLNPNSKNKSKKIFAPEMSWSSYLLTYLSSGEEWTEFIGVDVMSNVIEKSKFLYSLHKKKNPKSKKTIKLYEQPSESLLKDSGFLREHSRTVDTIFYCPPYFDMEIYPDSSGKQSIDLYPDYESWLNNYLFATLKLCNMLLKPGGKMAVMIGNYHKKLNGEFYDLIGDFNKFMEKQEHIHLEDMYFLKNRTSPLKNNDKLRGEILFIFTRK